MKEMSFKSGVKCRGSELSFASDYIFQPIAVENLGSFDSSTSSFLSNPGSKFVHHLARTKFIPLSLI